MGKQQFPQSQVSSQFISEIPDQVSSQKSVRVSGSFSRFTKSSVKQNFDVLDKKINPQHVNQNNNLFSPSDVVDHKVFGKGIVISVEKSSGEEELIIKFDNISVPKRIIPSFGSLNKMDSKK